MPPINSRLRFYLWCDSSSLTVDYAPAIQDYPSYPRKLGLELYLDKHKSAFGSNFWRYARGSSAYWDMDFEDVSDSAAATFGLMAGSAAQLSHHVAIYEWPGIDGITQGSLLSLTGTELVGTFFIEGEAWLPQERVLGNWGFSLKFRREG